MVVVACLQKPGQDGVWVVLRFYYNFNWSLSLVLIFFLMNSNDEKKTALTAHDLPIETARPRYMCLLKNSILMGWAVSPRANFSEFF